MQKKMKCDIIIPVWNEPEATAECIDSIKKDTHYPYRLIIIDNASLGPTQKYLSGLKKDFPDMLLMRNNENLGFVKAVNQGLAVSDSPYVCVLNNDTVVAAGWLTSLIDTCERGPREIGMANPASNVFGNDSADGDPGEWQELDSCRGFCMLIKREVIKKVGLLDEAYGLGYFEEKDFSRRAVEAGYISVRAKSSYVFHKDRLSFDKLADRNEIFKRNEAIYNERWGRALSIAFVIDDDNALADERGAIYGLLRKGHRVNIFYPVSMKNPELKDHIQLKYFPLKRTFFLYKILYKIYERRIKKKIEVIVAGEENAFQFFRRYAFLHRARVTKKYGMREHDE